MKMSTIYKSCLVAVFGLTASTIVTAHPPNNTVAMFQCPITTGTGANILTNFGDYIGGNGYEMINGDSTLPYQPEFDGPIVSGSNIPPNLSSGNYINAGTSYASSTGTVSCHYVSTSGFDPFDVSYKMTNGYGGNVVANTNNEIAISLSIGIAKSKV